MKLPEKFKFEWVYPNGNREGIVYTAELKEDKESYFVTWISEWADGENRSSTYSVSEVERNVGAGTFDILPESFEDLGTVNIADIDYPDDILEAVEDSQSLLQKIKDFSITSGKVDIMGGAYHVYCRELDLYKEIKSDATLEAFLDLCAKMIETLDGDK